MYLVNSSSCTYPEVEFSLAFFFFCLVLLTRGEKEDAYYLNEPCTNLTFLVCISFLCFQTSLYAVSNSSSFTVLFDMKKSRSSVTWMPILMYSLSHGSLTTHLSRSKTYIILQLPKCIALQHTSQKMSSIMVRFFVGQETNSDLRPCLAFFILFLPVNASFSFYENKIAGRLQQKISYLI